MNGKRGLCDQQLQCFEAISELEKNQIQKMFMKILKVSVETVSKQMVTEFDMNKLKKMEYE